MKLARYIGDGRVEVVEEAEPTLPVGGLLVETEACGLCSGELMAWYMDRKLPHVLGHEVAGRVIASGDDRFPVGCRVFPHHHAPCLRCELCQRGAFVQCAQWKRTRLVPGGMAERFAVSAENLTDTHRMDDLRPEDAALTEPLACVVKSLAQANFRPGQRVAVIGLGVMGLLHMLALANEEVGGLGVGFELNPARIAHAEGLGMKVGDPNSDSEFDVVFVCPGSAVAVDRALKLVAPRGTILLFAPFGPAGSPLLPLDEMYFKDITLTTSYSAGPDDTAGALRLLRAGSVKAEAVVSDFIALAELPDRYVKMRDGQILKAMVRF